MRLYFARFVVFLVFVLTGTLAVLAGIYLNLNSAIRPAMMTYSFVSGDQKQSIEVPIDTAYYNDFQYMPFISFAEFFDFTISGDINDHTFIARDSGEYISFTTNSTEVKINNSVMNMDSPARVYAGELYVPISFVEKKLQGISIKQSDNSKYTYDISDSADTAPVSFTLKDDTALDPLDELKIYGEIFVPPYFKSDLSSYQKYFTPSSQAEYLVLINKDHGVSAEFAPTDLIDIVDTRKDGRPTQRMREVPEKALEALFIEARANGYNDIAVTSGYRDYYAQELVLNEKIDELKGAFGDKAREEALKTVNLPGFSEHQSGLCVDISAPGYAGTDFGKSNSGKWLAANAHYFGFILRYPADKVDITGISYEPWHFRYVGRHNATRMNELGMCFEEYIDYLSQKSPAAAGRAASYSQLT